MAASPATTDPPFSLRRLSSLERRKPCDLQGDVPRRPFASPMVDTLARVSRGNADVCRVSALRPGGTSWDDFVGSTECVECMSVAVGDLGIWVTTTRFPSRTSLPERAGRSGSQGSRVSGARSAGRRPDLDGRDAGATIIASPGGSNHDSAIEALKGFGAAIDRPDCSCRQTQDCRRLRTECCARD
jgi:hypothetical protein